MATAPTFTKTGSKASSNTALPKQIFNAEEPSADLIHQVYVALSANNRKSSAKAKNRALVRGGGKKPWQQKGTGRARAGSIRSPLWRGGGITFAPTGNENYRQTITKSMKRTALTHALTVKNNSKQVAVIEDIDVDGKVSSFMKLKGKLPIDGRMLIVTDSITSEIDRSTRNVERVDVTTGDNLHVKHVMDVDMVLFTKPGLDTLKKRLEVKS